MKYVISILLLLSFSEGIFAQDIEHEDLNIPAEDVTHTISKESKFMITPSWFRLGSQSFTFEDFIKPIHLLTYDEWRSYEEGVNMLAIGHKRRSSEEARKRQVDLSRQLAQFGMRTNATDKKNGIQFDHNFSTRENGIKNSALREARSTFIRPNSYYNPYRYGRYPRYYGVYPMGRYYY